MRVLGIESSCDETAAALLENGPRVHASVVASQIEAHRVHGGVVPELAARAHLDAVPEVLAQAVPPGQWDDVDAVAVTCGPGLASSLMIGVGAARALADRLQVPLYAVHHMEGHLLSLFLSPGAGSPEQVCPALILLVTGGHTALVRMQAPGEYTVLGRSIDDAAGEALDKGARLMGLPYPGGPEIERLAQQGDMGVLSFPAGTPDSEEARARGGEYAFSFSGLKTALRYRLEKEPDLPPADVACAYQDAVMRTLITRAGQALADQPDIRSLACVGGVARNQVLRGGLEDLARGAGIPFLTVPMAYCTDNAAMIALVPLMRNLQPETGMPVLHPSYPLQGARLR